VESLKQTDEDANTYLLRPTGGVNTSLTNKEDILINTEREGFEPPIWLPI